MEQAFTKEQLLDGIRVIDKFLEETEQVFAETEGLMGEVGEPNEFSEEWAECIKERRVMKNIRILFARDLKFNHGIEV